MAALKIPRGKQGSRPGMRGIGNRASPRPLYPQALSKAKGPARRRHLRRNGPVRVQYPCFTPVFPRARRMSRVGTRLIPVLGRQAADRLAAKSGGTYVDATFGAGGYSRAIREPD